MYEFDSYFAKILFIILSINLRLFLLRNGAYRKIKTFEMNVKDSGF